MWTGLTLGTVSSAADSRAGKGTGGWSGYEEENMESSLSSKSIVCSGGLQERNVSSHHRNKNSE